MIVGTAGHIDHGKTALVRALTGVETDRLPEEKRRGITIELGFAAVDLDGVGRAGVVDVPGHEDFVRTMLAGATGIDLGLLVIAADEGVMPQTREHLLVLELLAIPRLVVALTKSDIVDREWIQLVREEIATLLAPTPWPAAAIVPCSAKSGDGIDILRERIGAELAATVGRDATDLFRLPIDRAFTVKGTGTVVTGTVWSGTIERESFVRVLPAGKQARVRKIEHHGAAVERVEAGDRAAIALSGVDIRDVERGFVLVSDDHWRATSRFEATVTLAAETLPQIGARTRVSLHLGSAEVEARLVSLPEPIEPGVAFETTIRTWVPITARGGDRFVLRLPAPVGTVGGGVVTDPYATRRGAARSGFAPVSASPATSAVSNAQIHARFSRLLISARGDGLSFDELPVRVGCNPAERDALAGMAAIVRAGANLYDDAVVEDVMAHVRLLIAEYEIRSPLSAGMPVQTLRGSLRAAPEVTDLSLRRLSTQGEIETGGGIARRKGWVPTPGAADTETSLRVAHDICSGRHEPPSIRELVVRYGASVPALLRLLEKQGRIVQVEPDRFYDREALSGLLEQMKRELLPGQVYAPGELREKLGVSRKYLIPFLEFCDRSGITERRGEGRVLKGPGISVLDTPQSQS
ncbi:MAG: selenocysteine-specific translation elongation factor [Gemmatimonadaceae bacterium]|nr:selenocysteine-specific translation elongation factor [Gemmatimonadaceae bacterium]